MPTCLMKLSGAQSLGISLRRISLSHPHFPFYSFVCGRCWSCLHNLCMSRYSLQTERAFLPSAHLNGCTTLNQGMRSLDTWVKSIIKRPFWTGIAVLMRVDTRYTDSSRGYTEWQLLEISTGLTTYLWKGWNTGNQFN